MKSVADAAQMVLGRVARLASEKVALREARGRVLAEDVVAARALPGFDNSAMDGYAARSADLPATLPIAFAVYAGQAPAELPVGACARVMTGAAIPLGADTVVIQEDAVVEAAGVKLPASVGKEIRRAGEDLAIGETAVAAGVRLGAGELGVLAALGVVDVPVRRAPRVAVIATGDELVDAGTELGPGQLVDSSAHMLAAMIADAGGACEYMGIARDDERAIARMIERAMDHDAVITTGGVSVGDKDFVKAAFAAAGVTLDLWKVAMRPGKPFAYGDNGKVPVFGLPGNPVSTFTAFELFVRPALLAMQGAAVIERARAPVTMMRGYRKQAGRAHYLRARVVRDGERLVAHPHPKQGSAMLTSVVGCNALVEMPADVEDVPTNSVVMAILLETV